MLIELIERVEHGSSIGRRDTLGVLQIEHRVTHRTQRHAAVFAGKEAAVPPVSYTHLRAHETVLDLVCRLLLEKKKHTYTLTQPHIH